MDLTQLGINETIIEQARIYCQQQSIQQAIIGRVSLEHKHSYRVITEQGELLASISGSFAYHAFNREDFPAVGDFVVMTAMPGEERGIIHYVLPRKSKFTRKMAGSQFDEQIVATNVDYVLLTMSLNDDFNVRRLERYLIAAWDSGANPVIVLTKSDLCSDVANLVKQVEDIAFGVRIVVVSAKLQQGIDQLQALFTEGLTIALLGSSGAGKSTLVNCLLGKEHMVTSAIREDDAKGRHTTTYRELIALPTGGCVIDTPGMRELQMWDQEDSLQTAFSDIEQLAKNCRFRDCSHNKEPHCAVNKAVEDGVLDKKRLVNYFKLQRELAYVEKKAALQSKVAEKRLTKRTK